MRSHTASIASRRPLEQAGEAVDVVLGQAVEMVGDDRARELALAGVVDRRQLQLQALGDVARADAAAGRATARASARSASRSARPPASCRWSRRAPRGRCAGSRRRRAIRRSRRPARGRAASSGRTLIWLCRCWRRPTSAAIMSSAPRSLSRALLAHARRRLLPVLALVGRVGDRRHRLEVDAARIAVAVRGAGVDAGRVVRRVLDFEKRIAAHRVVHFLREVERRQLQQANRVLQPRRDGVLLALAWLEGRKIHRSVHRKRR